MPPKVKYSKDEISTIALNLIRQKGIEKLTARELALSMETSVRPIFTAFENMNELRNSCHAKAMDVYHSYFSRKDMNAINQFLTTGKVYISFAIEEANLFNFVFMDSQDTYPDFTLYMKSLDDCFDDTLKMIQKTYDLPEKKAFALYKHMRLYTNGIATLCAKKQCSFTPQETEENLNMACSAFIHELQMEQ